MSASQAGVPLVFEENRGQLPQGSAFAGRTRQYAVELRPEELRFALLGQHAQRTVTVQFSGSQGARPEGVSDSGFRTNIYVDKDPRNWRTGIRNFDRVALRGLYTGVDAEFYSRGNEIEHDFFVAPNADASAIGLHLSGAKTAALSPEGDLVLSAEEGALRFHKPMAYQLLADGSRQPIEARFALENHGATADVHFELGAYDHARTLVIDPVISYATYVAGTAGSSPAAITSDAAGNVYLTGYTLSAASSFAAVSTQPATPVVPSGVNNAAFLAKLAPGDNGSKIAWVTYYGATSGDVRATAVALQPAITTGGTTTPGSLVYIAGNSKSNALPGTASGHQAAVAGDPASSYGFIAAFNIADGSAGSATPGANYATYVDGLNSTAGSATTQLNALTVDSNGNVTAVGSSTAGLYPTTASTVAVSPDLAALLPVGFTNPSTFCSATGQAGAGTKGLLTTLDPALAGRVYSSYICGDTAGAATNFYNVNGVSVQPNAGTQATYYLIGSTNLRFPQAGVYNLPTVTMAGTPPVPTLAPAGFWAAAVGTANVFAASLDPNSLTVNYSFWSNGNGTDTAAGLYRDPLNSIYFGGGTNSSNLSSAAISTTDAGAAPAVTSLNLTYPTGVTNAGFAGAISSTGHVTSLSYFTGATTGTNSTINGVAGDSTGLYLAGNTNEIKAKFPQGPTTDPAVSPTMDIASVPGLPTGQDVSADSVAGTLVQRAFLLKVPGPLTGVFYRAYFGPTATTPAGSASGVGITSDGAAAPNAYVAVSDTVASAATKGEFTTASAAQQLPQAHNGTTSSAYVAQVAYAASGTTGSLVAGAVTSDFGANPVAYLDATHYSTPTFTFTVTSPAGGTGATAVVFNLPYNSNLRPYAALPLVTIDSAAQPSTLCTLGTATAANTLPGITCVLPSLSPGSSAQISVATGVSSTIAPPSFVLSATAFDAQGDSVPLSITVPVAGVPTLTLTDTVTSAQSGPPVTVNAATTAADTTTPNRTATYTYVVKNTSTFDSPQTKLTPNLPASFTAVGAPTITITGGTPSTPCTDPTASCDLPGGATLTYSISGVFLASSFGNNSPGPFTATSGVPQASFSYPQLSSAPVANGTALTVNVVANAIISVALSKSAPTYNGTNYKLGDTGVQLIATVSNSGANQAGSVTVNLTLPQGFTATGAAGTSASGATVDASCSAAPYTSCKFSGLNGQDGSGNPGTAVFTVTGRFNDTGLATDAVAPPSTAATPTAATATGSATSGTVTASVASVAITGAYTTAPSTPSTTYAVSRVNALSYTIAAVTPASLAANTVNETNTPHTADSVTYTAAIANTGTSVVRGLFFTIPVPSPATATVAVTGVTATPASGTVSTANQLTCAPYVQGNTVLTCYERDLTAVPAAATVTPAGVTYTVTYTATFNETTVPLTTAAGTATVTQTGGSLVAAAAGYTTTATGTGPAAITVQRATTVVQDGFGFTRLGAAPASFEDTTDINLDEHTTGNVPGVNDTLQFAFYLHNSGPNDAAGVTISIPLPANLLVAIPVNCTMNGTAGVAGSTTLYPTGTGVTMTCAPPSSTTPAGVAANQLLAGGSCATRPAAPVAPALASAAYSTTTGCFTVYFDAKFADSATATNSVVLGNSTGTASFFPVANPATSVNFDVDANKNATISTPANVTAQRAAHVRLITTNPVPVPVYSDNTSLPVIGGSPLVAQGALRANVTTQALTSGKVYNCFRYTVSVVNDGPNYANTPQLNYSVSSVGYVPYQRTTVASGTTPAVASAINCNGGNDATPSVAAGTTQTLSIGSLPYGGGTRLAVLDGYFDVGTLGAANSGAATFTTKQFTAGDYKDSNKTATTANDFQATQAVAIGNTPMSNGATAGFAVTPYGSSPQVQVVFSNVSGAGITASSSATTTTASLPSGRSPYPPDANATKALYRTGNAPVYYTLRTSAVTPFPTSAAGAPGNPTSVCVARTGGLPDLFVKPERVLMWALTNLPTNDVVNPVPRITSTGGLAGDVTLSVTPVTGGTYIAKPATITFPQPPQSQPQQVCGQLNGLSAATDGSVLAVLEPVNFPPVSAAGIYTYSTSASKGSTTRLVDIFLQKTATLTNPHTYDYNDADPCYVGTTTTRATTCNDNDYLTAILYGGGYSGATPDITGPTLVSSLSQIEPAATQLDNAYIIKTFNLTANSGAAQFYVAVADQATGADANNKNIPAGQNPYGSQGNFLNATGAACDPGTSATNYVLSSTPCAGITATATAGQLYIAAGAGYTVGNVGVQSIASTITSGSGLIALPFPDPTTPPTVARPANPGAPASGNPLTNAAIGTVTPGQTVGFIWNWLNANVAAGVNYKLACTAYSDAAGTTVATLPAGTSCNIATNDPSATDPTIFRQNNANFAPTIFVITSGTVSARQKLPSGMPSWMQTTGGIALALMIPVLGFRRRFRRGVLAAMLFLGLAGGALLTGCGTGGSSSGGGSGLVTPAGNYYFRVTATPQTAGPSTITSAVFEVIVQKSGI